MKIKWNLKLFLFLYILLFFAIILPFHYHADSLDKHDDCVICALSHQSFVFGSSLQLVLALVSFSLLILAGSFVKNARLENPLLRGPPSF